MGNNLSNMKKNFLFIAAFAAAASSYAGSNETAPVLLPTYTIEASRRTDAEAKVDASLAEFRRAARHVVAPAISAPSLPAAVKPANATEHVNAARSTPPAFRVAVKA